MSGTLRRLLGIACLAIASCGGDTAEAPGEAPPWVRVRGTRVTVELARSDAKQTQGLSDRKSLGWDQGMLFQYPDARPVSFWMLRMHFPIDIVWIRDGRLVGVAQRVPPPPPGTPRHELRHYRPSELVDTVLEVPAGFAEAHGWRRGDRVELSEGAVFPPADR
jgi:hypothetical protein